MDILKILIACCLFVVVVAVVQTRFLLQQAKAGRQDSGSGKWYVPINFNAAELDFNNTAPTKWLIPTRDLALDANDRPATLSSWKPDLEQHNWVRDQYSSAALSNIAVQNYTLIST